MTSKEKIRYLLSAIKEKARISPLGAFYLSLVPIIDADANGGLPDGAPVLFSRSEQRDVLEKFQSDLLIWIIEQDERGAWIALCNLDIEADGSPYDASQSGTRLIKPPSMKTDLEKGVLVINEKPVFLSTKAGKENNPLRLLKTLMKEPDRYWFADEILVDWEQFADKNDVKELKKQKRIPRNRVYNAARALNTKVLDKSDTHDFIEYDTAKYRINPKYLGSL